jgi:hypothetical protein
MSINIYNRQTEKLRLFENYKIYLSESADINGLIDALQEERKLSFDYSLTKSMRKELVLQRPKTDSIHQKTHRKRQSGNNRDQRIYKTRTNCTNPKKDR